MQIYTVTRNGTPVAVVRARGVEDAIDAAGFECAAHREILNAQTA